MYWLYRTHIYAGHKKNAIAKLITPATYEGSQDDCGFGFKSPRQNEPYGVGLELVYQIDSRNFLSDNYAEDTGFTLFSDRLVKFFDSFDTKFESFPVTMVDENGNMLPELKYQVFHSLEGVLNAMDEEKSEWRGSSREGIPHLVLDETKFEHRPIFICNHIYVQLMRDDLKQEIKNQAISGFDFLSPERFRSGRFGSRPDYDD